MTDRDRLGRAAVHYAAADGDTEGLWALLAGGADPEEADSAGWTPLHFAAQAQSPLATEVLLAAGATVDATDGHGNTPLWRAVFCSQGEGATIRLLLEAGADPDRGNAQGVSPRALAGRIANYDVAAHLPGEAGGQAPHQRSVDASRPGDTTPPGSSTATRRKSCRT
ncbi:MAG: ankyrin repeat domain-containing protein [Streptomyces sp.]